MKLESMKSIYIKVSSHCDR